jgi:SynChlorMet cassette protein ScmC
VGRGVLIAAAGGTGKSTCSTRIPKPWRSLGDDLAFVMPDVQGYNVHPFPTWSNFFFDRPQRSWNVQEHAVLDTFFFLEQAQEDSVEAIGKGDAAMRIYNSSMQICTPMFRMVGADALPLKQQVFNNACDMSKSIPSYILKVKLTGRFWEEMDRVLLEA